MEKSFLIPFFSSKGLGNDLSSCDRQDLGCGNGSCGGDGQGCDSCSFCLGPAETTCVFQPHMPKHGRAGRIFPEILLYHHHRASVRWDSRRDELENRFVVVAKDGVISWLVVTCIELL